MTSQDNSMPRIYDVYISDKAYADLDAIYAFIKMNSETDYYAEKQVGAIETEVVKLAVLPNGCPEYNKKLHVRVRHFKKYCIFFVVDDDDGVVNVVRIFNARQDYQASIQN